MIELARDEPFKGMSQHLEIKDLFYDGERMRTEDEITGRDLSLVDIELNPELVRLLHFFSTIEIEEIEVDVDKVYEAALEGNQRAKGMIQIAARLTIEAAGKEAFAEELLPPSELDFIMGDIAYRESKHAPVPFPQSIEELDDSIAFIEGRLAGAQLHKDETT